jgi:hypothetical protein
MPVKRNGRDRADARALGVMNRDRTVLWLVCHYPETPETDERVAVTHSLQKELGIPVWLFGSRLACQQAATEDLIKAKLLTRGVSPDAIVCSGDMGHIPESFDTVQETLHVLAAAKARGIETIICISNRLQLWQVRGLARDQSVRLVYYPTALREWRWWYLLARCTLIPLAFLGVGRRFPVLEFIRRARARWQKWTV